MKYSVFFWISSLVIGQIFRATPYINAYEWSRVLAWYIGTQIFKRFLFRRCPAKYRLKPGSVCIVTGSSCGIGAETARELIERGGKVIFAGRDTEKANRYLSDLIWKPNYGPRGYVLKLDLADFQSIRDFVAEFKKRETNLDILILNAAYHGKRRLTKEGFETNFGVNHLGHMYLTYLLKDYLLKSKNPARVITVASDLHRLSKEVKFDDLMYEKNYSDFSAYNHSKLLNILFSRKLSQLWKAKGVAVHSVHPGTPIQSGLMRNNLIGSWLLQVLFWPPIYHLFCRSTADGAATPVFAAVSDSAGLSTGNYYENCRRDKESKTAQSDESADKLWKISCEMLKIDENW